MTSEARHIIVRGQVQGVGFRYFVRETGLGLGLTGDVCNRYGGEVEIVVEGGPGPIAEFVREIEKGPPMSRVQQVNVQAVPPTGSYASFLVEGC